MVNRPPTRKARPSIGADIEQADLDRSQLCLCLPQERLQRLFIAHIGADGARHAASCQDFLDEWCFYAATELDATSLYVMRRHGDLKHIYGEAPIALESAAGYFAMQLRHAEQALQAELGLEAVVIERLAAEKIVRLVKT